MKSSSRHDLFTFWHERYVIDKMISKSSYEHPAVLSTHFDISTNYLRDSWFCTSWKLSHAIFWNFDLAPQALLPITSRIAKNLATKDTRLGSSARSSSVPIKFAAAKTWVDHDAWQLSVI
jgi:hypothetical protein